MEHSSLLSAHPESRQWRAGGALLESGVPIVEWERRNQELERRAWVNKVCTEKTPWIPEYLSWLPKG